MIRSRRDRFNREFDPARYHAFLEDVRHQVGVPVDFRLCETPCFFPRDLLTRLSGAALEMVGALLSDAAYRAAADAAVPPEFRLAGGESRPTFLQIDFGLVQTEAGLEGRLVELQAFPSLYAFQPILSAAYVRQWALEGLDAFLDGLDADGYRRLLGHAIVGPHDPEHVVLMEIDPLTQKTLPDFIASEQTWGIRTVNVRDVTREGRRLFYTHEGRRIPIARIYNRVVPDDITKRRPELAFDYRDDLDVEWTGGPDWFFKISKFSIPWLRHPWVPETRFLDQMTSMPADRDDWLLKPLFSFAGGGITFAPTDADIAAIPAGQRHNYILQRRVAFTPVIDTPEGPTQAEIRVMLVDAGGTYRPVIPLIRMGRGRMMGVDHNKGFGWVGASAALLENTT